MFKKCAQNVWSYLVKLNLNFNLASSLTGVSNVSSGKVKAEDM